MPDVKEKKKKIEMKIFFFLNGRLFFFYQPQSKPFFLTMKTFHTHPRVLILLECFLHVVGNQIF